MQPIFYIQNVNKNTENKVLLFCINWV